MEREGEVQLMKRELGVKVWSKGKPVDDDVQLKKRGKTTRKKERMVMVMRRG